MDTAGEFRSGRSHGKTARWVEVTADLIRNHLSAIPEDQGLSVVAHPEGVSLAERVVAQVDDDRVRLSTSPVVKRGTVVTFPVLADGTPAALAF